MDAKRKSDDLGQSSTSEGESPQKKNLKNLKLIRDLNPDIGEKWLILGKVVHVKISLRNTTFLQATFADHTGKVDVKAFNESALHYKNVFENDKVSILV